MNSVLIVLVVFIVVCLIAVVSFVASERIGILGVKRKKKRYDNEEGCGVPFLFHTTPDDPFFKCCVKHDKAYDVTPPTMSTYEIDKVFLECCLKKAGEDKPLKTRAKLYYFLARKYGQVRYAMGKLGLWKIWERI